MNNTALIYDITFYQVDEDGNDIIDQKGNTKTYRIKEGLRFKPLEYLVDDIDLDILEEVKQWVIIKRGNIWNSRFIVFWVYGIFMWFW